MTAATLGTVGWDVRHAARLNRFELVGLAALLVFLTAASFGVAGMLDATGYGTWCNPSGEANPVACESMGRAFYDLQGSLVPLVQGLMLAVPFIGGLLLGVPLIARELERGTSRLAWSLAPSRARWFLARLLPLLVVMIVVGLVAGVALDRLYTSIDPWSDLGASFDQFGSRGVVLAARVVFVFAIGVALGAVAGRTLPALLVAIVLSWVAVVGGSWVHGKWLASEAVLVDDATGGSLRGALYFDQRLRDPSGAILTWDEAYQLMPPDDESGIWPPEGWTFVSLVVPGERYPTVAAREVVALGLATLVFLGIAGVAVGRRRPG